MLDADGPMVPLLRQMAKHLDEVEGTAGWIAALRFGVAGALAEAGEGEIAAATFQRLLSEAPAHLWARVGLIDILMGQGKADMAATVAREGLSHLPGERVLWRKAAEAVAASHGPAAAAELMAGARNVAFDAGDLRYAIGLHRSAGTVAGAADLCERLLAIRPDDPLAHMARIEIALLVGDPGPAAAAAQSARQHDPTEPELILRIGQALHVAGDGQGARDVLAVAPPDTAFTGESRALLDRIEAEPATPEQEPPVLEMAEPADAGPPPDAATVLAALDEALAAGDRAQLEASLSQLVSRPDLPWYVALKLVDRAVGAGAMTAASRLSADLVRPDWSWPEREAFAIEDLLLRSGPLAALDWVRKHPVGQRDREAAERLGRVLVASGSGPLAARYLRACCRRWPDDDAILRIATEALLAAGRGAEVPALTSADTAMARDCRVDAALAETGAAEAHALCIDTAAGQPPMPVTVIELSLLTGDLDAAEEALSRLTPEDGPLEDALICRPRATRVGTLLNEARILSSLGIDWIDGEAEPLADAAAQAFYLPARTLLSRALDEGRLTEPGHHAPEGPLHLVWPALTPPGDAAARIVDAWRNHTRREVRLLGPREVQQRLTDWAGPEAAQAYAMAPDALQKADLVMLAALVAEGGAAAMADQWPSADIDALLDSAGGALAFRDGGGALRTELVAAPAGHPLVAAALAMAVRSCLARENDHRWFKTGPGLMTRAAGQCLGEASAGAAALDIRPITQLRRILHPHRLIAGFGGGGRTGKADRAFAAMLRHLVASGRVGG